MGGKGGQHFGLLTLGDLGEIKAPSEFRGDRIEFCGRDAELSVRLLKAERRRARLGCRELEGPPDTLQTRSVRMNVAVNLSLAPTGPASPRSDR